MGGRIVSNITTDVFYLYSLRIQYKIKILLLKGFEQVIYLLSNVLLHKYVCNVNEMHAATNKKKRPLQIAVN